MPDPVDWVKCDGILMKEYGIKPWELQELTMIECAVMMLALNEEESDRLELKAGQDAQTQAFILGQMNEVISKDMEYNKLSPEAKLKLAWEQYR